jgi:hypothetical protein
VTIAAGSATFFGATFLLGVDEVRDVIDLARRKLR